MLPAVDAAARYEVLATRVHAWTMVEWHRAIRSAIDTGRRIVVAGQNLHGVSVYHRDAAMRRLHGRAYVRVDGMPLILWGRLLGYPLRREHRVTWVDWMPVLMHHAEEAGWRVFYLGAEPGVARRGAEALRRRFPGLQIRTHHGSFDTTPGSRDNGHVLRRIESSAPHLLLVGMGMPRQERWVLANVDRLSVPAVLTCGAAIEYFAGTRPIPPRWIGGVGLEWLYRLARDPRRLGRRYLIEPWGLLGLAVRDLRWRRDRR